MARSAAELRALVDAANNTVNEFQALAQAARVKAQEASQAYNMISEKLAAPAQMMVQAETRLEEALTQSAVAIELARAYQAPL